MTPRSAYHAIADRLHVRSRRRPSAAPSVTAVQPSASSAPPPPPVEPDLLAQRDRLIEKFTIMQADLGGALYEMAIRDHVRIDVLTGKAAELQVVDAELGQVERAIELQRTGTVGSCSRCDAPYGPGATFCSQCGHTLIRVEEPSMNGASA